MHRVCCWLLFFEETYFIYQYRDLIPTNIMLRGPSCSSLIALSSVIDLTIYLVFTYKISSAKENSVKILTAITISKGYLWTLRGDTYSWTIFTDSQNNKTKTLQGFQNPSEVVESHNNMHTVRPFTVVIVHQ